MLWAWLILITCRGKREYEPARYMTVAIAANQLLAAIEKRKDDLKCNLMQPFGYVLNHFLGLAPDRLCVGVARVGSTNQIIAVDSLRYINGWSFGDPLHSLVIIGKTHPLEDRMLKIVANATRK